MEGLSGVAESFLGSPPGRSDAVLRRCRDTIERLNNEVEDERTRRRELHQRAQALENDLHDAKLQIEHERDQRSEIDAKVSALERQVKDAEGKLVAQRQSSESVFEQMQKAKAESLQKTQELFARNLRITELEGALKRTEARVATAQAEVEKTSQELREANERCVSHDSEILQLRSTAETDTARLERANRVAEERERRCEALQHDLDEARAATQAAEDAHRVHLVEARARQEKLFASMRDREAELRRSFTEQAEQSAVNLGSEVSELRQRLADAEANAARHERLVSQLQGELASLQPQLQTAQADRERAAEDLRSRDAQLAGVRAELEASQHQMGEARRLGSEHREAHEKILRLTAENAEKHRQLEEAQQQLAGRASAESEECRALRRALDEQQQRSSKDAETKLEELSLQMEVANKEVERSRLALRTEQEELRRREGEASTLINMLSQAQRQAAEIKHESEAHIAALEKELDKENHAQDRQLAETSVKVREIQAESSKARRVTEEAAEERVRAVEVAMSAKVNEMEAKTKMKVEHLKQKYEQKISKLYQRLGEREAHELRLRSLLEKEVDVLHNCNRELDKCCSDGRRSKYYKKQAFEDLVVDRMKGMADKAERRILQGLSRADLLG